MWGDVWEKAKALLTRGRPAGGASGEGLDPETVKEVRAAIMKNGAKIPPHMPLTEIRFVSLDLETTGFSYGTGDEIIAVGAVAVQGGRIKKEDGFHRFIYPYRLVPGKVVRLTGIGPDMLVGCPSFVGILPALLEYIGDSVIVGHCIDFDLNFINVKLKKYFGAKIRNRALDTSVLARVVHPARDDYSLDGLLAFYGVDPAGRHTAAGDALLTAQVFLNLLKRLKEHKVYTFADLEHFIKSNLSLGLSACTPGY